MLLRLNGIKLLNRVRFLSTSRLRLDTVVVYQNEYEKCAKPTPTASSQSSHSTQIDVPGLSNAVVQYGSDPVGPGASKSTNYKNPEYFSYHQLSYYEAEIEMAKYRLPQPSNQLH
ncbi:hypothetical protein RI129_007423 [Pyrocoelia pectoralis]|uniref:Complex I-9kD n=1 Tax=Pyrocoelia pectoralis TaxID=417401 RepID=A0AAN7VE18_9COLE